MVPLARTMADSGLIDTYPGLVLAYVAQFLPFTIYLMTSYYNGIPSEIVDAARIDGNSLYGVYRRIMLPIGTPALLSVGILDALFCWNDVLIALLMMPSAEHRTLMVGVTSLRGPVLRRHPHLRRRRADRRGTRPGDLPVLPAPDRRGRHRRFHERLTCGSPGFAP